MSNSSNVPLDGFLENLEQGLEPAKAFTAALQKTRENLKKGDSQIILVMGYPAGGKTSYAKTLMETTPFVRLNRDALGGKMSNLPKLLEKEILEGSTHFLLDNLFATAAHRKLILDVAKKYEIPVTAHCLSTSIENAQFNAAQRIWDKHGRLLSPSELGASKDPNVYSPVVLFSYRKKYEPLSLDEGFAEIKEIPFVRADSPYDGKALFLDYDGNLRECVGGNGKYPITKDQVRILPGRVEILKQYQDHGYRLLGVSNQSGVAKGILTKEKAQEIFEHTNELLGLDIEIGFCPHRSVPLSCFCRKPMPGFAVHYINKYRLDRSKVLMIGDLTSDKTFAFRGGVKFVHTDTFFADGYPHKF
jgi:histidinol-phosphate phosphatase family protein